MTRVIGFLIAATWAVNLWWPGEIFPAVADATVACAFAALIAALASPLRHPPAASVFWGALALGVAGLSVSSGWDPYRSAESLLLIAAGFAACLALRLQACDDYCRRRAIHLFLAMSALLCVYGLYQCFIRFPEMVMTPEMDRAFPGGSFIDAAGRAAAGRVFSRFALPSTFACVLLAALPFALDRFTSARRAGRPAGQALFSALIALMLANLYLTRSYGAALILILYASVYLLSRFAGRRALILAAAALFAVAAAATLRPDMLGDWNHPMNPARLRWLNWQAALQAFADSPWLGVGPGNYALAFAQYTSGEGWTRFAHSVVFRALCETGILGGAVFLAGLTGIALWLRRNPSPFAAALGLILAYSLIDITFEFHSLLVTFFVLLGLAPRADSSAPPAGAPAMHYALFAFAALGLVVSSIVMRANHHALQGETALSNPSGADSHFQRALELWPNPEFDRRWAGAFLARGDLSGAVDRLRAAIQKSPRNVDYRIDLGHLLVLQGDTAAAQAEFAEAFKLNPRRRASAGRGGP